MLLNEAGGLKRIATCWGLLDFEAFRPELDKALASTNGANGGRPAYDQVMMLKVLMIQTADNLSHERTEFLINDRLSFMRLLGLGLSDRVPDARTIWDRSGIE